MIRLLIGSAFLIAIALPTLAMPITFNFRGLAGMDLSGEQTGQTSSGSVDGSSAMGDIVLTLLASSFTQGNTGEFNLTRTGGFGVVSGDLGPGFPNDDTDQFDDIEGVESATFSVTSNVPLSRLVLTGISLSSVGTTDRGELVFSDMSTILLSSSGRLAVDRTLAPGEAFTLQFVAGNGFGLDSLDFDATAVVSVPEPSTLVLIGSGIAGLAVTRRQKLCRRVTLA